MKKLILILTISLLVSNVLAVSLSEEELQQLKEEYNSLPEDQIKEFMSKNYEEIALKDLLTVSIANQKTEVPAPVKKFLPFNIKVNRLDKPESFIIAINKDGNLNILDDGKYHILAEFNLKDLINGLSSKDFNGETLLENANLIPNSFKGALALNTLERMSKKQIVNSRSFGYRVVGVLTAPISLFIR